MTYKNFSLTSPGSRLSRGPTLYYAYALPIYMHTPYLSSHAPCKRIEQIIHTLLVVPLLSVSMETEDLLVIMCVTLIAAWWFHLLGCSSNGAAAAIDADGGVSSRCHIAPWAFLSLGSPLSSLPGSHRLKFCPSSRDDWRGTVMVS